MDVLDGDEWTGLMPLSLADGLLYLPEILYRRILNQAFGPGGWGMVPRGEMTLLKMMVSREWGLVASGRYALPSSLSRHHVLIETR